MEITLVFLFCFIDESTVVWYDFAKPVHPQLHSDYLLHLAEVKARSKNRIRAIRPLVQNLRLVKSSAEIDRMKIAGKVTSQVLNNAITPYLRFLRKGGLEWSSCQIQYVTGLELVCSFSF